jgi:hypothetical protein
MFAVTIITLLPFFIEMLQYYCFLSGHMMIKEMVYIPITFKPELARASITTSEVNNQWRCFYTPVKLQKCIIITFKSHQNLIYM